jgi:hypothetical protein
MRLSVIIPVYNGGDGLALCLEAVAASTRPPDEVIVVDDGSTDGSGDLAARYGAHVIRLDGPPRWPAFARNRGAEAAQGDLLVFFDADVVAHADTVACLERCLVEHPEIAAAFGSYDANPPARGIASRYKNLLHHFTHQHGRREASTFWSGCGAIRRDLFFACGGFNESFRMIEDIELGVRLWQAGHRVWLRPDIQVTHLKCWTLISLLRSDILDRAVPWTHLILASDHLPDDLNVGIESRLSAFAAWAAVGCLVLAAWTPWAWIGVMLAAAAVGALNAELYRFFAWQGGPGFALAAAGLHALYLLYSSLVFGGIFTWHMLRRKRGQSHAQTL